MAQFLPSWYKLYADYECRGTNFIVLVICHGCKTLVEATWRSVAGQTWSDSEICHGVEISKRADERVRVQAQDDLNSVQEQTSKNCDKKMTTTVRVSTSGINCGSSSICLRSRIYFFLLSGRNFDFRTD